MTTSSSFHLLDERIQRFIWSEGWESLRDAQEAAIPLILKADRDVIVAAATASGKTEAAFLPALTHMLQGDGPQLIVYISPLKALINDQFGRLQGLCEQLDIPVWPWHGDVSATVKTKFLGKRHGVLLITPESLEALLCNRGTSVRSIFEHAAYFVVDELHAFIGSERGKQLQSLLHRIEVAANRRIPRIGLSATLGDMRMAADFLRPGYGANVEVIESKDGGNELHVLVKGYEEPLVVKVDESQSESDEEKEPPEPTTPGLIAGHLFKTLRGSNNLVFPNSRREVERYTHLMSRMCETQKVPNEFWPHHGNLSKEIRSETEAALKQKERPATAICTNTLELGIDIGSVKSVAQIGPSPTVASLRQRLGRSGRRKNEPAILRGYSVEDALDGKSGLTTQLRLDTVQMAAMVSLLAEKWFEPPRTEGAHFSTLIQQMLSVVAQNGGASIAKLYSLLCGPGTPFQGITKAELMALVRHMAEKELLMQDASGDLLHGAVGEKFVNHYSFYAAFASDEEFRVVSGGRTLGTLPVSQMLTIGQRILFAGKTWRVDDVDEPQKAIFVTRTRGGVPPLFSGGAGRVHTVVRQRMRELLQTVEVPAFLDITAKRFLEEGRENYKARDLRNAFFVDQGSEVMLLTWLGDAANAALACLVMQYGLVATAAGPGVEVRKGGNSLDDVLSALQSIAAEPMPELDELLSEVKNLSREKWDWALPDTLLRKTYASLNLDLDEALQWTRTVATKIGSSFPEEANQSTGVA